MAEAVQREAMQQPSGENERAAQREATRQPDDASKGDGMLRWRNEKPRDNQPGEWEAKARREVAALAKALAEQRQWWVSQQSTKKRLRL